MRQLDATDRQILALLQDNARTSNSQIARTVGLAPSAVSERIRRLERDGIVLGYEARVAPAAVGMGLLAFVAVRGDERPGDLTLATRLSEFEEVQEVHHIAGDDCFLVKVRAASPAALGRFLREQLGEIDSVMGTRSTIVLDTVVERGRLPTEASEED